MKCSGCNGDAIDTEHGEKICSNCGLVQSDSGRLQTDVIAEGLSFIHKDVFNVQKDSARACKDALQSTLKVAKHFNLSPNDLQEISDTFESLVRSSTFLRKYLKSKMALGGVVILIITNRRNLMIPKERICEQVGCSLAELKATLNMVLEANPSLKPAPKPLADQVPYQVAEAEFDPKETGIIEDRSKKLMQLISQSSLMDGKNPTYVVHAALCLAWKSVAPKERGTSKTTFRKFCSSCSLSYSTTANQRFKELNQFVSKLVLHLPWNELSIEVIKKNVAFHLLDVLNHAALVLTRCEETDENPEEIQEASNLMANYVPIVFPEPEPEISDREIESYIRSDKEIKLIKNLSTQAHLKAVGTK